MLSHEDLLGIVATEAVEAIAANEPYNLRSRNSLQDQDLPTANYNLRLIRHPDGRLEWKD